MTFGSINACFAALALLANALTLTIVVAFLATRLSPAGRLRWTALRSVMSPMSFAMAWIIATFCTCASLFLQFAEQLDPCDLCWFQRVCMYPQALILGIALISRDRYLIKRYVVPLSVIGALISFIHINVTSIMSWLHTSQLPGCSLDAPCSVQPITEFGWITIPYMALSGFAAIVALLAFGRED